MERRNTTEEAQTMPSNNPTTPVLLKAATLKTDLEQLLSKIQHAIERLELEPDEACHLEPTVTALATVVHSSQRHAIMIALANGRLQARHSEYG